MKKTISKIKVSDFGGVRNQYTITTPEGYYFQSYKTIIVAIEDGKTYLDAQKWDYSNTTGKYRNLFLRETRKETEKKIKSGEYQLVNLN
jgi:hypothetical protein